MTKFTLALVAALILGSASAALADPKAFRIPSSPSTYSGTMTDEGQDAPGSTIGSRDGRQLWTTRRR